MNKRMRANFENFSMADLLAMQNFVDEIRTKYFQHIESEKVRLSKEGNFNLLQHLRPHRIQHEETYGYYVDCGILIEQEINKRMRLTFGEIGELTPARRTNFNAMENQILDAIKKKDL